MSRRSSGAVDQVSIVSARLSSCRKQRKISAQTAENRQQATCGMWSCLGVKWRGPNGSFLICPPINTRLIPSTKCTPLASQLDWSHDAFISRGNGAAQVLGRFKTTPWSSGCGFSEYGYGSKLNHQETAGFSPCVQLPVFHFRHLFLTHTHMKNRSWAQFGRVRMTSDPRSRS